MRALFTFGLVSLWLVGCTPGIPVDDMFGTSALVPPTISIPPEFAEFNAYDREINPLLGDQMCATSYQPLEEKAIGAAPGHIVYAGGRCRTHIPLIGDLSELPRLP